VPTVVEVRFKGNRREFFSWEQEIELAVGDPVVVPVDRGQDLGHVSALGELAEQKCGVACNGCEVGQRRAPKGSVVRKATAEEAYVSEQLRITEQDVRRKVLERVRAHKLSMKVSDAEWQWDRKKLTVYFTADKRVDFRALVRDLASLFRTRIELRQIGARDESRRIDGLGRCGRQYCCSSWLPELRPVSLCGRLLCCLRYEHEFYVSARKRFPKLGRALRTAHGRETVETIDIFRDRVVLKAEDQTLRTLTLAELKSEVAGVAPKPAERTRDAAPDTPQPDRTEVTTDHAVQAVTPRKRRRRRPRRRRGGRPDSGGSSGGGAPS
jgi:cell fate regulator YaaT (PSP1 superfamily)